MSDNALERIINRASHIVDSFLQGPYESSDQVPGIVVVWTADLAAYYATLTWRKSKDLTQYDPVYLRYQSTMDQLNGIAKGTTNVPSPQGADEPATVENQYTGSLFNTDEFDLTGRYAAGEQGDSPFPWPGWPGYGWPGYGY